MSIKVLPKPTDFDTFENGVLEGEWVAENFFRTDPETESYMNEWFDYAYSECNATPEFKKGFMSVFRK